ncbi:hypothetical protein KCU78_g62, partial [Aureobasidium melanogenum]
MDRYAAAQIGASQMLTSVMRGGLTKNPSVLTFSDLKMESHEVGLLDEWLGCVPGVVGFRVVFDVDLVHERS